MTMMVTWAALGVTIDRLASERGMVEDSTAICQFVMEEVDKQVGLSSRFGKLVKVMEQRYRDEVAKSHHPQLGKRSSSLPSTGPSSQLSPHPTSFYKAPGQPGRRPPLEGKTAGYTKKAQDQLPASEADGIWLF